MTLDREQGMCVRLPNDLGPDLGACGRCRPLTPFRDEARMECVACLDNSQCGGLTPLCSNGRCSECGTATDCAGPPSTPECNVGECVECVRQLNCTTPTASRCLRESCTECTRDSHCSHLSGTPHCVVGTCRECTPETEAADCGGNTCNPATGACTDTLLGSRGSCASCVSDSDCRQRTGLTFRCIRMNYMGEPRGGYCLQALPGCTRPYGVIINQPSLSGATAADYCGIDQNVVSCEGVTALRDGVECPGGNDSECMAPGALCRMVGFQENQCTHVCGSADDCPLGLPCGNDGYCGQW